MSFKFKLKLPAANKYEILFFNKDEFNYIMTDNNIQENVNFSIVNNKNINLKNYGVIDEGIDKEIYKKINTLKVNYSNTNIINKYKLLKKVSYFGMYFNYTNDETLKKRFNRNQPFNYKFYNNSNFLYDQIKSLGKNLKSLIISKSYQSYKKNEEKIIQGIKDKLEEQNINKTDEEIKNIVKNKIITRNFVYNCIKNIPKKIILDETDIKKIKDITNNPNDIQVIKNIKNNNTNKIKAIKEINIKNIQEILKILHDKTDGSINHYIILDIKKDSYISSIKNIRIQKGGNIFWNTLTFISYIIRVFVAFAIGIGICIGFTICTGGFGAVPGCGIGLTAAVFILDSSSKGGKPLKNELLSTNNKK